MAGALKGGPLTLSSRVGTTGLCCSATPLLWPRSLVRVEGPSRSQSPEWTTEVSFSVTLTDRAHCCLINSRRWSMTCREESSDRPRLAPGGPVVTRGASSYLHLPTPLAGDAVRLLRQPHQPALSVLDEGRLSHGVVILWTEILPEWWSWSWAKWAT